MRAKVGEDQGSVEAVNRAVYATCAALIWHQGLGSDALALAEGRIETPSKVARTQSRAAWVYFLRCH